MFGATQVAIAADGEHEGAAPATSHSELITNDSELSSLKQAIEDLKVKAEEGKLTADGFAYLQELKSQLDAIPDQRAQAVIDAVAAAFEAIKSYSGDDAEITSYLQPLDEAINQKLAVHTPVGGTMSDAAFIELVGKLKMAVESRNYLANESSLTEALMAIEAIAASARFHNQVKLLQSLSKAVNGVVNKQDAIYLPELGNIEFQTQIASLIAVLETASATPPAVKFNTRAAAISALLDPGGTEKTKAEYQQLIRLIRETPDAILNYKTLLARLVAIGGRSSRRLHILAAEYGDLRKGAKSSRRCNAVAKIRADCQSKASCAIPGTATVENYCGYDPVPLVDASNKSIAIRYFCMTTSKDGWDMLAIDPYRNPNNSERLTINHPRAHLAVLKVGAAGKLTCASDTSALYGGAE